MLARKYNNLEANYNELTLTSAICSEGLRPNIVGPAAEDPGTAAAIARIQQAIQRGWSDEVGNRLSAEEMRLALQQAAADAHEFAEADGRTHTRKIQNRQSAP